MILQINDITSLLTKDGVTVIGVLLGICVLLIWDKVRTEKACKEGKEEATKKFKELFDLYEKEQEDNKKILIELVTKSILATEKNTQAIINIKDAYISKR